MKIQGQTKCMKLKLRPGTFKTGNHMFVIDIIYARYIDRVAKKNPAQNSLSRLY